MPQFTLIAHDAKDADAPARRIAQREAHLAAIETARRAGNILIGLAMTDATGAMTGSIIVTHFPSRAEFDAWLAADPYTTGKVWHEVSVLECRLAPAFQDLLKAA